MKFGEETSEQLEFIPASLLVTTPPTQISISVANAVATAKKCSDLLLMVRLIRGKTIRCGQIDKRQPKAKP